LLWGGPFVVCSLNKGLKPGNLLVAFTATQSLPCAEDFAAHVSEMQEEVPASSICFPVIFILEVISFSKLSKLICN